MKFEVGQIVHSIPERKSSWMPNTVKVAKVHDHGRVLPGVSHRYSITGTDGHIYSGWWFDPDAKVVPSKDDDYDYDVDW